MTTERLKASLPDGTSIEVIKTTREQPGYPGLAQLPSFALDDGETLTPVDDSLRIFRAIHSGRIVNLR